MSAVLETELTLADLFARFGPIPDRRIRRDPAPGTATEKDVVRIHDREGRLCELVDGILVEKDVGLYESLIAVRLVQLIGRFLQDQPLGEVFGTDGMMKLQPGLIRVPDVSFVASQRLRKVNIKRRRGPMPRLAPNLAVEVISAGNTKKEMERKLGEYFDSGVQLVWMVYPYEEEVKVYSSPKRSRTRKHPQILDGGRVLPGLQISLAELFAPLNVGDDKSKHFRVVPG
jgi:Uma2 family endonuclease